MSPKQLPVNGQSISLFRLSNDERSVVSGKVVEIKDDLVWIDLPPDKQISQAQKLIGCEFLLRWGKENSTHDLPVIVRDVSKDKHLGLAPRSDEKREFMRVESSLPMEFRIIHEGDRADAEREVMAAATEASELEIETDRFWHQENLGDRLEGEFGQIGRFLTQLDAKLDYLIDLAEGNEPQHRPAHRVHSLDISGSGISFLYDQSLDEDTLMVVTVELSQFPHAEAKVLGRVRRCLPHASEGKTEYEIGIHFELLRDDTQELIFRFISRAERKMLRMRRELLNN
jgi:hypothetical protein